MLKVYFFGYGGHSWMADKLRNLIEDELGMQLFTIHEHPNADIKWNLDTVYEELKKADIIIVPANYKRQPCKSNNKLTQAMALAKPTVCSPLPAYQDIVRHGINSFILLNDSEEEWRKYLTILRDNPDVRQKMGIEALKTARNYTQEATAESWLKALSQIEKKADGAIDVVIPTKNNPEILAECLKSFENSSMKEDIYIIDNGNNITEESLSYLKVPVKIVEV